MGLLQRLSPGRPLIAALTYPRRMKYIKSRKQRAGRNATAVTSRAPPQRAHLRAVLAAAGGARGAFRGCGAGGGRAVPAAAARRDSMPSARARRWRCEFLTRSDRRREEGAGSRAGEGAPSFLGCAVFALPPPPPDASNEYFWAFEN